jgi:hypothetical protein
MNNLLDAWVRCLRKPLEFFLEVSEKCAEDHDRMPFKRLGFGAGSYGRLEQKRNCVVPWRKALRVQEWSHVDVNDTDAQVTQL